MSKTRCPKCDDKMDRIGCGPCNGTGCYRCDGTGIAYSCGSCDGHDCLDHLEEEHTEHDDGRCRLVMKCGKCGAITYGAWRRCTCYIYAEETVADRRRRLGLMF